MTTSGWTATVFFSPPKRRNQHRSAGWPAVAHFMWHFCKQVPENAPFFSSDRTKFRAARFLASLSEQNHVKRSSAGLWRRDLGLKRRTPTRGKKMNSFARPCSAFVVLITTFFMVAGGAHGADFGGNCCVDLEDRIAELEATAARKGNRKVSLEISGHMHQAILFWDDGEEDNAYVVTNDTSRTRLRFRGKAKISADWSAGYRLELGFRTPRSDRVDQNNDDPASVIDLRYSSWFVKSKQLGEVHVGLTESSSQGITEIHLARSKYASKNADPEDYGAGFQLRAAGGGGLSGLEWRRILKDNGVQPGEGARGNHVYYKSPSLAGFTLNAAWGEDDNWDVGLRYAGELGDFKVAAGIAYGEASEDGASICETLFTSDGRQKCSQTGGSVSVVHNPTGLFLTFAAGVYEDENATTATAFQGTPVDDEHTFYALMAGIEQKLIPLGKTTLWGEYFDYQGGANERTVAGTDALNPFAGNARIWDSGVQVYGIGISQDIDAAAMAVYVSYRRFEGDLTLRDDATGALAAVGIEDLDTIMTGAQIKF